MKKLKFFSLILFPLLLGSCSEGSLFFGPGKVNGIVKDATTNAPIANAHVTLFEEDAEFLGSSTFIELDDAYSDANGEFFFDFEYKKGMYYLVYVYHPDYWEHPGGFYIDETYGKVDVEALLAPSATLKIYVVNIEPSLTNDHISFNTPQGYDDGPFFGAEIDTSFNTRVYGNINTEITYFVYFNDSLLYSENYSIFTPAFDTTEITIEY